MFETARRQPLDLHDLSSRQGQPVIMGVLNVTPDSFSDGGRYTASARAFEKAQQMVAMGADIIDVGGESTRPGAAPVSVDEEIDRVVPVIHDITASGLAAVSIDTSKPEVMTAAVAAGATMINDVWALRRDGALKAAAALGVPVCLMHMQGEPGTMQQAPHYDDPLHEVITFLQARADACLDAGIPHRDILLDPGFGFGKRLSDNLDLLCGIGTIAGLGFPVLAGLSRKSMIGELTGKPVDQRLVGSVILAAMAVEFGASVVRVHDVAETREALLLAQAVRSHQKQQQSGGLHES